MKRTRVTQGYSACCESVKTVLFFIAVIVFILFVLICIFVPFVWNLYNLTRAIKGSCALLHRKLGNKDILATRNHTSETLNMNEIRNRTDWNITYANEFTHIEQLNNYTKKEVSITEGSNRNRTGKDPNIAPSILPGLQITSCRANSEIFFYVSISVLHILVITLWLLYLCTRKECTAKDVGNCVVALLCCCKRKKFSGTIHFNQLTVGEQQNVDSIKRHPNLSLIYDSQEHSALDGESHQEIGNFHVNKILDLIKQTWRYDDRLGIDAVGLRHKGMSIKQIYKIENKDRLAIYRREKLMMMPSRRLPKTLQDKPILTTIATVHSNQTSIATKHDKTSKSTPNSNKGSTEMVPSKNALMHREDTNVSKSDSVHPVHQQNQCIPSTSSIEEETWIIDETEPLRNSSEKQQRTELNSAFMDKDDTILFHGSKLGNIASILENGFDLSKARPGLYGKAIYLAESSEKADQYADFWKCRRSQDLTMFIVRTALGTIKEHGPEEAKRGPARLPLRSATGVRSTQFDSVVTGLDKRFREFLVFDSRQCYPEFLIFYDRVKIQNV